MGNNMLTHEHMYRLCKWFENLDKNDRILIRVSMAKKATEELGFSVTENNISAASAATGIPLQGKASKEWSKNRGDNLSYLARQLKKVMEDLGQEVPERLRYICDHKRG